MDFKRKHPRWSKEIIYWCPHSYSTIMIHTKDGTKLTYNYDTGAINILENVWGKWNGNMVTY